MNSIMYSIIVPVYKSVETLRPLYEGIQEVMQEIEATFEVIFVEDFGKKESWQELLQLKKHYPENVIIIKLSRNFGQNGTTICGIDESRGKKVITIDDDLQIHPREILKLIVNQKETDADVVYGNYAEKASFIRRLGSTFIKWIFNRDQGGSSIGSSFRLIDEHIVERLKFHSQDHLFINQIINWYTLNYQFVDVERQARSEGTSGYSFWKLVSLSFKLFFYYTNIPLKLTIYSCVLAFIGCISLIGYHAINYNPEAIIFDVFSMILILGMALIIGSIGVLAIYINRIYTSRIKRPNYAIKYKL